MQGDSGLMCFVPGIHKPFSSLDRARIRKVSWLLLAIWVLLAAASLCQAQITNVTDQTSAPTPGAGHNYFHMLAETVNPSNGSVSLRINIPVPKGRGLTIPFSFDYNSNGVSHPVSMIPGYVEWQTNYGYLAQGGWSYGVPLLSSRLASATVTMLGQQYTCKYTTDYVLEGPNGGRHALPVAAVYNPTGTGCQNAGSSLQSVLTGSDSSYSYQSTLEPGSYTALVANDDGTTYTFPMIADNNSDETWSNLPHTIEDRNGNVVNVSDNGNGAFTFTDTAGRSEIVSSGFGSTGNTVTVSGLSAYKVTWGTASGSYDVGSQAVGPNDGNCPKSMGSGGNSGPVITAITLPNGQQYQFQYDPTYGLLSKVIFPSGAWVSYTWAVNSLSEYGVFQDSKGNANQCQFRYGSPVVTHRYVSFDGQHIALQQDFSYSTTWSTNSNQLGWWTQKTTTVTTHDLASGQLSYQTVYTYEGQSVAVPPNEHFLFAGEIPVEKSIAGPLETVNKTWAAPDALASEQTVLANGPSSEKDYSYNCQRYRQPGVAVYDWGSSPHGPLLRKTVVNCASFAATPIYPSAPSIFDRPSSIVVQDGSGNPVAETDYSYDSNGNALTRTRDCLHQHGCTGNATTTYTYDQYGNVTSMKDPNGYTTTYKYTCGVDNDTYLSSITDPLGHTVSFGYDCASGELTSSTDENSETTSYAYSDPLDRLTSITYPDGGETTYTYNDTPPNPTIKTDKLISSGVWANPITTTMDGAGHVIKVVGENGAETDTVYDGEGQVYQKSNPYFSGGAVNWTDYTYDALGRVTSITNPDGSTVTTNYSGKCSTTTDEDSHVTTTCTNGLGRVENVTDALGNTTSYTHDAFNNLQGVTEGAQTRTFDYNSLSELYSETQPESGTTTFTYDGDGNVLSRTDARGITINYAYDADDRLEGKTYSDGETAVSYGYDGVGGAAPCPTTQPATQCYNTGRRTSMTDASGNTLWTYDAMGRVLVKQQTIEGTTGTLTYSYDLDGSLARLVDSMTGYRLDYTVNAAEQETALHSETDGANYVTGATYAPQGALATMTQGNGVVRSESYDSRLRPSTITAVLNSTDIFNLAYGYDGDSNVTQVAQTNVTNADFTANYTYDALNRIYSASSTGSAVYSQQFGYDNTTAENDPQGRYGNVSCTSASNVPCSQLTFNLQTNRIALIGSNQTPTYDAAGEMTSDGTGTGSAQYTWNAEGLVATVTPYGGTKVTYIYDGDGRLAAEESGSQTLFWYGAGGKLLGTTGGSVNIETIYFDGRRIAKFVMAPAGPWGANFYDNADGSLLLETDIYGNTNCRANYDPFGDPVGSGCQAYEGIQYAGLLTDVAGGNYLATHRQLSDTYYRWLSSDPSGRKAVSLTNPQTWNMYAYALDNPTSLNDPSGEDYNVCTYDASGKETCTRVTNDAAFEQALKNPGEGITTVANGNTGSGEIYTTSANGQQQLAGTYQWVPPTAQEEAILPNNGTFFGAVTSLFGGALGIVRDLGEAGGGELENLGEEEINRAVGSEAPEGLSSDYVDKTGPSALAPNRFTNVTEQEFGDNLKAEGYSESIEGDLRVYTKGGTEYDVYSQASSTGGPTAQMKVAGRVVLKIRLQP